MQENVSMRTDRHHRNTSPYRNPLQATQDQAILPKSHSHSFPWRQEIVYSPTKRAKLSKPVKQHDSEPPILPLSNMDRVTSPLEEPPILLPSTDSSDLECVHLSPPKGPSVQEHRSAFSMLQKITKSLSSNSDSKAVSHEPTRKHTCTPSKVQHVEKLSSQQPSATLKSSSSPVHFDAASQRTNTTSTHMQRTVSAPSIASGEGLQKVSPETPPVLGSGPSSAELHKKRYLAGVPIHFKPKCSVDNEKSDEESSQNGKEKLCFGIFIQTLLEGCQEEGHHNDAIDFIQSFTNVRRCPSDRLLNYILEDILMTRIDNSAGLVNAFKTLKHIQYLHPKSKFVQWKTVRAIMQVLLSDGANVESNRESDMMKFHGNMLALKYITSLLVEDMEMQSQNVNRSYVYNMLSSDSCIANAKSVLSWISQCVQRIHEEEQDRTSHTLPSCVQDAHPPPVSKLSMLYMVLELLQKLLHMCLAASANLDQTTAKVADEFLYIYRRLPSYENKRKVLQVCVIVY